MNDVVVTGVSVLAPGVTHATLLEAFRRAGPVEPDRVERLGSLEYRLTRPELETAGPYVPTGREAKAMRRDVVLGVACAGHLLAAASVEEGTLVDSGLYVATGLCQDDLLEEQIQEMSHAYLADYSCLPEAERNHNFFRRLPPLIALVGLSNACACFIARDFGIRGPNTVFGATSHAGHAAVREGFRSVASGRVAVAVVGAANAGGKLSAIALSPLAPKGSRLHEAEAAAFLLLESGTHAEASGRTVLCRVASVRGSGAVPNLRTPVRPASRALLESLPCTGPESVLLAGGSVFERDEMEMRGVLARRMVEPMGWFDRMGSAGAASVPLDVGTAAQMIHCGRVRRAVCVNRDVFGRESIVTLEAAT